MNLTRMGKAAARSSKAMAAVELAAVELARPTQENGHIKIRSSGSRHWRETAIADRHIIAERDKEENYDIKDEFEVVERNHNVSEEASVVDDEEELQLDSICYESDGEFN